MLDIQEGGNIFWLVVLGPSISLIPFTVKFDILNWQIFLMIYLFCSLLVLVPLIIGITKQSKILQSVAFIFWMASGVVGLMSIASVT